MGPVTDWIVNVVLQHYSAELDAIESQAVLFDGSCYLPDSAVEDLILLLGEVYGTVGSISNFFTFLVFLLFAVVVFDVCRAVKRKKKSSSDQSR